MVVQFPVKEQAVGSNPTLYKNAKSVSVVCEKHLMLDTQVNQVHRSSQGESGLYQKFRSPQGLMDRKFNGKQDTEQHMTTSLLPGFKNGDADNRRGYRKGLRGCREKQCSQGAV